MDEVTHLIVGSGPVGSTTALTLAEMGYRVRVLTRSKTGPSHPNIELVAGNAIEVDALLRNIDPAGAIVNAANPPYNRWAQDWPPMHASMTLAAERSGAFLVVMDNLYAFGKQTQMPMNELSPINPTGKKGRVRAEMATELLQLTESGKLRAAIVRASDFYGPGVTESAFGERFLTQLLNGKKVSFLGSLETRHSISYMPDVAKTIVAVITKENTAGKTWLVPNAPAVSQREIFEVFEQAIGVSGKVSTVPRAALRIGGIFNPILREFNEIWYQFAETWTTDSSRSEEFLDIHPTPLEVGVEATINWWRERAR